MKVLYYCPEYYCNYGARTHAHGFFHALEKLPSVSECFLYPKGSSENDTKESIGKKQSQGKLGFLPNTLRILVRYFLLPRSALNKALVEKIHLHKCDVLVMRTNMGPPDYQRIKKSCPDAFICLEINGIGFHEKIPNMPMKSFFHRWAVYKFNQADAISVVSSDLKSYLVRYGMSPNKILVNQNGVPVEIINQIKKTNLRQQLNIPENAIVLGYIGGMEPFRKLPMMVRLFAEMRRKGHKDIYMVIVGDGADMSVLKETIQNETDVLDGAIKCVGWQEHSEVPKFLSIFDIAIFPFTNDYCSPLKLFEYLGAGLPVIGPDTSTVRHIFEDGVHLKLAKQDGSDFINTILELKNNPALRKTLGENGKKLVMEEFTWEKNAQRVVDHIQLIRNS